MTEILSHKESLGIFSDFLVASFIRSVTWQSARKGTDGSMLTANTTEHDLDRLGIELEEAQIEAQKLRLFAELDPELTEETREALWFELIDCYNFLISAAVKSGLSPDLFMEKWVEKNEINDRNYPPEAFEGKTVKEGIKHARKLRDEREELERATNRRRNGHPAPESVPPIRSRTLFAQGEEQTYSLESAGSHD